MKTVNCSEMLTKAIAGGYAVPQFNVNGLEWTKGILEVCEELRTPGHPRRGHEGRGGHGGLSDRDEHGRGNAGGYAHHRSGGAAS